LAEHVARIDSLRARLKLYDLLWTPQNADVYARYYVNAIATADALLSNLPKQRVERAGEVGRRRIEFELPNGGIIEVKESEGVARTSKPCAGCTARDNCLEAFGDYVRIEPYMRLYFCYLRRDIGFDLKPLLANERAAALVEGINAFTNGQAAKFFRYSRLRYIAVPACNFNCGFPSSVTSWCHKATGNFRFPPRLTRMVGTAA
jgi:GTP 3',8-cyclase